MKRYKRLYLLLGVLAVACIATFGVLRFEEHQELMSYFVIAEGRAEAKTFATTKSASTTAEIISEYEPPRKAL